MSAFAQLGSSAVRTTLARVGVGLAGSATELLPALLAFILLNPEIALAIGLVILAGVVFAVVMANLPQAVMQTGSGTTTQPAPAPDPNPTPGTGPGPIDVFPAPPPAPTATPGDPCEAPKVVCFSHGARRTIAVPYIALHIETAQTINHKKRELTYGGSAIVAANRYQACGRNLSTIGLPRPGLSCDEYPFASTYEGGAGATIAAVPVGEQDTQRNILRDFYRVNFRFVGANDAAHKFLVLVVA